MSGLFLRATQLLLPVLVSGLQALLFSSRICSIGS